MNPDAFTTTLLLGTARIKAPPPAPFALLEEAWNALDWTSQPESAALAACALRAAAAAAGFVSRSGFPDEPPCPPESCPAAPAAAGAMLRRILSGEAPECLTEWLDCCRTGGFLAAPRDLPALLERASRDPENRPAIADILGERGVWLARREGMADDFSGTSAFTSASVSTFAPTASADSENPASTLWETGTLPQRLAWFRAARTSDPATAAAALEASWAQESGDTRLAFLTVIAAEGASDAEVPVLETSALKDRRREVRQLARAALMALPRSAFADRAFARASVLLRLESGSAGAGDPSAKQFVLTLPEAFDPSWKADGIEEKPPAGLTQTGPRAFHAVQLLSAVPLSRWTEHFQMEPDQLLAANRDLESASILLTAWLTAALAHPEAASAEALARHLAGLSHWPADAPQPAVPAFLRLLSVLPPAAAAALVLSAESGILRHTAPGQLLIATRFPLPPDQAGAWLAAALTVLQTKPYPLLQSPAARQLALRFPISFLPEALRLLAAEPALSTPAEAFARLLEFRQLLHTAFQPAGT